MFYRYFLLFPLIFSSCDSKDGHDIETDLQTEMMGGDSQNRYEDQVFEVLIDDKELESLKYLALHEDDSDASFKVFNYYTYGERDYEKSYYWCYRTIQLRHPSITLDDLILIERSIISSCDNEVSINGQSPVITLPPVTD